MPKISELTEASALDEDDFFVVVEDGVTKRVLKSAIITVSGDYGDGSDDALVVATGTTTTPTREMYYSSIEIQGTGKLDCYHAIYCNGTVDISGVTGDGGIIADGNAGAAGENSFQAGGTTNGGAAGAQRADGSVGGGNAGGAGADGTSAGSDTGQVGGTGTLVARAFGGAGSQGGRGGYGTGVPTASIASGGATTVALVLRAVLSAFNTSFFGALSITNVCKGGAGGGGGNSGTGCGGANLGGPGGAGGGGGGGAGVLLGRWKNLKKGASTPAGAIRARGGAGAVGGNCDALTDAGGSNQTGGGAGGGGAGGGYVNLDIDTLEGPAVTDLIVADGGASGAGGNGFIGATPAGPNAGGSCGAGGKSGQISVTVRSTGTTYYAPAGVAGGLTAAGSLGVGAPSAAGGVARATL